MKNLPEVHVTPISPLILDNEGIWNAGEADSKQRQKRKQLPDNETTGQSVLVTFITPLRPVNKVYLNRNLKDA
jgi:hypothetical protein